MPGKPVAAAVFVALIAILLTLPLRDADRDEISSGRTITDQDTPTPETSPDETDETVVLEPFPRTGALGDEYPDECLQQVSPPADPLLAHAVAGGVAVTPLDGSEGIVIGDEQAFSWSPSGSYLATGSGTIYQSGGGIANDFGVDASTYNWGWSPIADCALVTDRRGALVVRPNAEPVRIVFKPVERFAFSPTGGTLAYVRQGEAGASIWTADLDNGDIEELVRIGPIDEGEQIVLAGWAPDGSDLYYWIGAKKQLLGAGEHLLSATSESDRALPNVLAHSDFVTTCTDETLAVVGRGARTSRSTKRLAYVEAGSEPTFLTGDDEWAASPTCSPDGAFIAAVHSADPEGEAERNIAIFNADGSLADTLAPEADSDDASPLWALGDEGLLFVRVPAGGGGAEVWLTPPGGLPQPTGVVLEDIPGNPEERRDGWGRFLDWSADAPTGLSITTEPGG